MKHPPEPVPYGVKLSRAEEKGVITEFTITVWAKDALSACRLATADWRGYYVEHAIPLKTDRGLERLRNVV